MNFDPDISHIPTALGHRESSSECGENLRFLAITRAYSPRMFIPGDLADSLTTRDNVSMKGICILFALYLCVPFRAIAADVPGSSDPVGIKRYDGAEIVRFEKLAYERFVIPLGKMTKFDFGTKAAEFEKSEIVEGALTRISYRVPDPLRSSLEIVRNYENELAASGWEIAWRASGKAEFGNSFAHIYESLRGHDQLFTYNEAQGHVLVARKPADGLAALIFVTKFDMGLTGGAKIVKSEPIIQLDLLQTKRMEQKMVLVSADEMAKSIGDSGRVALYGINFDFNSDSIKPESQPTLAEIAKFLQNNSALKVLVVGHTDIVGGYDSNLRLSSSRAAAVTEALASQYKIDRSRLRPIGVSFAAPLATNHTEEGRSKNRRVELVELQ